MRFMTETMIMNAAKFKNNILSLISILYYINYKLCLRAFYLMESNNQK